MRSQKIMPFLLLGGAVLVVFVLARIARQPEERSQQTLAPLVRVEIAMPSDHRFSVVAHGAVSPRRESDLIPQVSGEIVSVSPNFAAGGFFEEDELLAVVDAADYRVDRETARAALARTQSEFKRADKERGRQRRLADRSVASESRIDDAENAFRIAEASLREARARLERAERDLARTELRAPYRGRVRSEQVDVGQFVTRGTPIARLYAVDYAEVRLPLPDRELAYLDVPLVPQIAERSGAALADPESAAGDTPSVTTTKPGDPGDAPARSTADEAVPGDDVDATDATDPETRRTEGLLGDGPRVSLRAEFAGEPHHWEGRLVRTEGELDPRSRMVNLVARVRDPYGIETQRSTPLAVGLFVEAEIEGKTVEGAFLLPRDALREGDRVYVVDEQDRLRFRSVDLVRTERDSIVVASGITAGDRVCTSPLEAAIDGMQVRVVMPEDSAARDLAPEAPALVARPAVDERSVEADLAADRAQP